MIYQHEDGTCFLSIYDILIKEVETIWSKQPECNLNKNAKEKDKCAWRNVLSKRIIKVFSTNMCIYINHKFQFVAFFHIALTFTRALRNWIYQIHTNETL